MTIDIIPKVGENRNDVWREVLTALGLSTGAAVALGLSRFAYALLLPPMRADLGWTYVEAGALNTANVGPTSITIVAQRQLPVSSWTAAISLLTVGFAFGQALSPILAGAISDATGSIAAAFWVSPVLLGAAACVSLLQRPPMLAVGEMG